MSDFFPLIIAGLNIFRSYSCQGEVILNLKQDTWRARVENIAVTDVSFFTSLFIIQTSNRN